MVRGAILAAGLVLVACSRPAVRPDARVVVFRGMCDASGAVELGPTRFLVANDEDNVLRVYDAGAGGDALVGVDVSADLGLEPKGKRRDKWPEADLEAATRLGDRGYWLTSHGRSKKGAPRPERLRFFATTLPDAGGQGGPEVVGRVYDRLVDDLIAAPELARFGLAAAAGKAPDAPGGLNIEGMTATPDGKLLLGFRNPVPAGKALLVPLENPAELLAEDAGGADGGAAVVARFGAPVELDLGGDGVRALSWWRGEYLVVSGGIAGGGTSRLWRWSGAPDAAARAVAVDLAGFNPEAFFSAEERDAVLLLSDDGERDVDGQACKKLKDPAARSFRGLWVKP